MVWTGGVCGGKGGARCTKCALRACAGRRVWRLALRASPCLEGRGRRARCRRGWDRRRVRGGDWEDARAESVFSRVSAAQSTALQSSRRRFSLWAGAEAALLSCPHTPHTCMAAPPADAPADAPGEGEHVEVREKGWGGRSGRWGGHPCCRRPRHSVCAGLAQRHNETSTHNAFPPQIFPPPPPHYKLFAPDAPAPPPAPPSPVKGEYTVFGEIFTVSVLCVWVGWEKGATDR